MVTIDGNLIFTDGNTYQLDDFSEDSLNGLRVDIMLWEGLHHEEIDAIIAEVIELTS